MIAEYMGQDEATTKAGVWQAAIQGFSNLGASIATAIGVARAPAPIVPGAVPMAPPTPVRAAMDPTILLAVGIPAALVAVALIAKKR